MAIRYVHPSGSAGNSGQTTIVPWPFQHALNQMAPGMDLVLMDADYTGAFLLDSLNGASGNPGIIRALNRHKAILTGSTGYNLWVSNSDYITVDGLTSKNAGTNGLALSSLSNCIVKNCWITNNGNVGIDASHPGNSNIVLEHCVVEKSGGGQYNGVPGNRWYGIYLAGPNHTLRNNIFRNNAGNGITFYSDEPSTNMTALHIYGNITYGHHRFNGMTITSLSDGGTPGTNHIYGNTILDGINLAWGTVFLRNNIILPSVLEPTKPVTIYDSGPPTLTNDYNLSTTSFAGDSNVDAGANDVIVANLAAVGFHNAAGNAYWLTSGSPARGEALSSVYGAVDIYGNAQSSVTDIGAFQYIAAQTVARRAYSGRVAFSGRVTA